MVLFIILLNQVAVNELWLLPVITTVICLN